MQYTKGDIWNNHSDGDFIVIPVNKTVNKNNEIVMGAGLALDAKIKFPLLPSILYSYYNKNTCQFVYLFPSYKIFTFLSKWDWYQPSFLPLIENSTRELANLVNFTYKDIERVFLPLVGCGKGGLKKEDVTPILEKYLDHKFICVEY